MLEKWYEPEGNHGDNTPYVREDGRKKKYKNTNSVEYMRLNNELRIDTDTAQEKSQANMMKLTKLQ